MIRLTREQYVRLRSGARVEVELPKVYAPERAYQARVAASDDGEHPARCCRVTVLSRERTIGVCVYADQTDTPRLLHKRSERGYTDKAAMAMEDEPEAIPESWDREVARVAELHRADSAAERAALAELRVAVDRLEKVARPSDRGRLQRLRAEVHKLERGMSGAAPSAAASDAAGASGRGTAVA